MKPNTLRQKPPRARAGQHPHQLMRELIAGDMTREAFITEMSRYNYRPETIQRCADQCQWERTRCVPNSAYKIVTEAAVRSRLRRAGIDCRMLAVRGAGPEST